MYMYVCMYVCMYVRACIRNIFHCIYISVFIYRYKILSNKGYIYIQRPILAHVGEGGLNSSFHKV